MTAYVDTAARVPRHISLFSPLLQALLRAGLPVGPNALITIRGRKSGEPRTAGVAIIEVNGRRWIWAPWGEVNWVRNLRAAGHATLSASRNEEPERIAVVEVPSTEAARLIRDTIAKFPAVVQSNFDVTPGEPMEAFEREAIRHPTFRIVPMQSTP